MVNTKFMWVGTPECQICGKSGMIYVRISEYMNWKNNIGTITNPKEDIEQLANGTHPDCYEAWLFDLYDYHPVSPEEEEMAPPDPMRE